MLTQFFFFNSKYLPLTLSTQMLTNANETWSYMKKRIHTVHIVGIHLKYLILFKCRLQK